MKKMKIHILLIPVLLGNAISLHGMAGATRASASKSQSYARKKFTYTYSTGSLWAKISPYLSRLWKALTHPKVLYPRIGHTQREVGKEVQKEVSKLDGSDQEKKETKKEDEEESEINVGDLL